jgi:glycerol-3-phosphate acyltransferase PlsX
LNDLTIALDAMGGDNAPLSVLSGAAKFASTNSDVNFILFGDETKLLPLINNYKILKNRYQIIHCEKEIQSDDKPSSALRRGRDSSMWQAIEALQQQQAKAVVSSGNTGALMAIAKIVLRSLPEIHRPAIVGIVPTIKSKLVMLDLGANAECSAENLFQFAIMGDAFAKIMLGIDNPKIGLLNIGSEDIKGNDVVRLASTLLKESETPINFIGYIEGNDIAEGTADVVVTSGFSGNIALKTAEGTAKFCKELLKTAFKSSLLARLGYLLASCAIKSSFKKFDHRLYNGAMFLGLNGIVVKSHGSADDIAFANAISVAYELARQDINDKIIKEMESSQKLVVE